MARAAISSSGTKYSLHSKRLPTSSIAGIMCWLTISSGSAPSCERFLRDGDGGLVRRHSESRHRSLLRSDMSSPLAGTCR